MVSGSKVWALGFRISGLGRGSGFIGYVDTCLFRLLGVLLPAFNLLVMGPSDADNKHPNKLNPDPETLNPKTLKL